MAKQFKNVTDLITGLSEDENFKKDAVKHISENGLGINSWQPKYLLKVP